MARILIIDDEKDFCVPLAETLSLYYEASYALNLEEADRAVSQSYPDLVLLDVILKGENGLDYLKSLKRRDPDLPVVIMTARLEETVQQEAFRSGAFKVLHKPIDVEVLLDVLSNALGGSPHEA